MGTITRVGIAAATLILTTLAVSASAADGPAAGPHIGEVRAIALSRGNHDVLTRLHQEGWVEANGQVLLASQYPDLYRQIGRAWTATGITQERFAIPRLRDATQPTTSSEDPYGVLGGGATTATSGRRRQVRAPLSYWIFVGQTAASETH